MPWQLLRVLPSDDCICLIRGLISIRDDRAFHRSMRWRPCAPQKVGFRIFPSSRASRDVSSTRVGWPAPSDPAVAIDDAEYDLAVLDRFLLPDEESRLSSLPLDGQSAPGTRSKSAIPALGPLDTG